MKSSNLILCCFIVLQCVTQLAQGFFLTLSLVGLAGLAGLTGIAGLKLYIAMKLLGAFSRQTTSGAGFLGGLFRHRNFNLGLLPSHPQHHLPLDFSHGQQHQLPLAPPANPIYVLPVVYYPPSRPSAVNPSVLPIQMKVKRAVPKSNSLFDMRMFDVIHDLDENRCLDRFFCEVGAKPSSYGPYGRRVGSLLDMFQLPASTWFVASHNLGKTNGTNACPTRCASLDLRKIIHFIEVQDSTKRS
jgi:hypothetical protein